MAGPMDIQRVPRGLVDLFGLKATGDAPHTLDQGISASVDFKDEYMADRQQVVTATPTIAGAGQTDFVGSAVPFDELWYLYHFSLVGGPLCFVNAVSTFEAWVELIPMAASIGLFVPGTGTGPLAAAAKVFPYGGMAIMFEEPILLRPGDRFSYNVATYTGTGLNSPPVLRLKVAKIKV